MTLPSLSLQHFLYSYCFSTVACLVSKCKKKYRMYKIISYCLELKEHLGKVSKKNCVGLLQPPSAYLPTPFVVQKAFFVFFACFKDRIFDENVHCPLSFFTRKRSLWTSLYGKKAHDAYKLWLMTLYRLWCCNTYDSWWSNAWFLMIKYKILDDQMHDAWRSNAWCLMIKCIILADQMHDNPLEGW